MVYQTILPLMYRVQRDNSSGNPSMRLQSNLYLVKYIAVKWLQLPRPVELKCHMQTTETWADNYPAVNSTYSDTSRIEVLSMPLIRLHTHWRNTLLPYVHIEIKHTLMWKHRENQKLNTRSSKEPQIVCRKHRNSTSTNDFYQGRRQRHNIQSKLSPTSNEMWHFPTMFNELRIL